MKILISAYACEPGKGSEPEAGWRLLQAASKAADSVFLVTRANNRAAIEASGKLPPNVSVTYFDLSTRYRALKTRIPLGTQLYYLLWQLKVRAPIRNLVNHEQIDLTHHLTFAVDWMPVATVVPGVPHVWGPVGGATGMPWSLWRSQKVTVLAREMARSAITSLLRHIWGYRTSKRSRITVVQNLDGQRLFKRSAQRLIVRPNVVIEPEKTDSTARSNALDENSSVTAGHDSRRALFVGRVIPHKGLHLLIQALARPEANGWTLTVAGQGKQVDDCARLAETLGIDDRVEFLGWIPRDEVSALLDQVDVLVAPSMYEGSGFAVAEAVAHGCPVIATDRGGPAVIVPNGAGILVPADRKLVTSLASALHEIGPRTVPSSVWSTGNAEAFLRDLYTEAIS